MGLMRPGPGLVGMAARTAVVAGTATAVSGRVARRQQGKYDQQAYEQQQQYEQQQYAQPPPQQYAPPPPQQYAPPPPAAAPDIDLVDRLQELGTLHNQGVLNDAQFEAAKTKLLA